MELGVPPPHPTIWLRLWLDTLGCRRKQMKEPLNRGPRLILKYSQIQLQKKKKSIFFIVILNYKKKLEVTAILFEIMIKMTLEYPKRKYIH